MEDGFGQLDNLIAALFVVAEGASAHNKRLSEALYGLANALEATSDDLSQSWTRLYHALAGLRGADAAAG